MTTCLNCDFLFEGHYCPQCGQKAETGRLRLGELVRDLVAHWLELNSTVLNTVIGLMRSPGKVCLEYVQGRRVRYVPPLRYFLTILAGIVLLKVAVGFEAAGTTAGTTLTQQQLEVEKVVSGFAVQHVDWVIIVALPIFVALIRMIFRGSRFTYAEVSVFVLYVFGQVMLLGSPLVLLGSSAPFLAGAVKLILQSCFMAWAASAFFEIRPWVSLLKSVLATALYILLVGVTLAVLALPTVLPLINTG